MANYELTVSMGYVPTWTHVDAVREIFQNAKDEETVNPENKMFFDYNEETETLMIGNKTGKLNKSTLLIGISDKRNDNRTIGQHGEGYKIATVVLLREGLSLKIYNFGCNEVWTAKKIKSRRYGVDIPAFDIQKAGSLLRPVANHDLVFEIQGITAEMYEEILESNNFKGYFQHVAFSIPKDGKFCNLQKFQRVFPSYEVRRNRVYWSMDPEDFISMLSFICASAGMDLTGYIQDLNYRLAIGALDEKDAKKYLLEQVKKDSNSPAALAADVMMDFDETDERYIQIFYRKAE